MRPDCARGPGAVLALAAFLLLAACEEAKAQAAAPYPTSSHGISFIFGAVPTAAGTVESESGLVVGDAFRSVPLLLKWTPSGLPRTEFSVGLDAVSAVRVAENYDVDVGDRLNIVVRHHLGGTRNVAFAIAPRATVFLRDEPGARLGGTFVAEWARGRHYAGSNLTITAATAVTELNPRLAYASAIDYSFGVTDRWRLFAGVQHAAVTGETGFVSTEQGTTFALRPHVSLEAGLSQVALNSEARSLQFQASLIVNWGRVF